MGSCMEMGRKLLELRLFQKEIEHGGIRLLGLESFRRADWIRILPLQGKRDELLESLLDVGEAAVISLAREQEATLVLIDEDRLHGRVGEEDLCVFCTVGAGAQFGAMLVRL